MHVIEELQKFGLTKIEAQVYYELLKFPNSNGSQISKRIETPRTSVYMALEKLYSTGFIHMIPGLNERKNYMAVEPEKLSQKLKEEYTKSAEYLKDELIKVHVKSDEDQFINLKGEDYILYKVKEMIESAQKEIYINTNIELEIFKDEIEQALDRRVRVVLFSFEKHEIPDNRVEMYSKTENPVSDANKRLMLVTDLKEVLVGSTNNWEFTGIYTKNSLMVNIVAEHIHNDIYLKKLEIMFGNDFWKDISIGTLNEVK